MSIVHCNIISGVLSLANLLFAHPLLTCLKLQFSEYSRP